MYPSLNIIRAIISRSMRWAGNVARMGETEYRVLVGNRPRGRPGRRCEHNMKEKNLNKCNRRVWTRSDSDDGQVAGCCEHGDEHTHRFHKMWGIS